MKRTKLFGLMMALVVGMGFTSCSDDEDAIVTIGLTSTPPEKVNVGDLITIKYNVVSDKKLESITIKTSDDTIDEISDFTSSSSHNDTFEHKAVKEGELIILIEAKDRDGNGDIYEVKIEVESNIESFTAVLMGSYDDANLGSFFSTVTGEVYKITPAGENSELIDFAYFYGSDNSATITAPDNDEVIGTGGSKLYAPVAEWDTRNATRFNQLFSGITVEEFDAMNNDALIVANTASDVDLKMANFLNKDALVAFITADGKKGIFKVADLDTEAKTITIDVKVQK